MRYKGNQDILVKYPDARRHMEFMTYDLTRDFAKSSAVRVVQSFLDSIQPKTLITFGSVDGEQLTKTSRKWPKVVFCISFYNAEHFRSSASPCSETRDENF